MVATQRTRWTEVQPYYKLLSHKSLQILAGWRREQKELLTRSSVL